MVKIEGKEIKLISEVLRILNDGFPTHPIPTRKWRGNELVNTTTMPDPHFLAYKMGNLWWICVREYGAWKDSAEVLEDCCLYLRQELKMKVQSCHVHPVSMGWYKQLHQERKVFMIGKVSWA